MRHLIIIILVFFSFVSFAQTNRHDTMNEVIIVYRPQNPTTAPTQSIDSSITKYFQQHSLQQLLQYHSNIFVKNYGVGGLSTISIRGSSAAQTQVLWNGININNAMNGLSDFSAIPVSFFDNIHIAYGSDIKNQGMGGAVILSNTKPNFFRQNKMNIALGLESMKNLSGSINLLFANSFNSNQFKLNISDANNEYSYFNNERKKNMLLTHARSKQINILNDYRFNLNYSSSISWHVWIQHLQREIPAAEFEDISKKRETIQPLRTLVKYENEYHNAYGITSSIGCFYERYRYNDSIIGLYTKADALSIPFITSMRWKPIRNQQLNVQVSLNHAQLMNNKNAVLQRAGLLASYSFENIMNRYQVKISAQQEVTPQFKIPLSGSIQFTSKYIIKIKPYISVGRTNRIPTLNDLYFNPGGNPHLKPEKSDYIEAGINAKKDYRQHHIKLDLTCYYRNVSNWIAWYGSSILTPHNIQRVESKGIEAVANYEYHISEPNERYPYKRNLDNPQDGYLLPIEVEIVSQPARKKVHMLTAGLFYAYTLSTTKESFIPNDYSIDKQIPYVPRYQLKANIGLRWDRLEFSYNHTYTGYRFVTTDESVYLNPFHTGNIFCSYQRPIYNRESQFVVRFNNIWNARVESIVGRVLPGRNASVSWMFKLF